MGDYNNGARIDENFEILERAVNAQATRMTDIMTVETAKHHETAVQFEALRKRVELLENKLSNREAIESLAAAAVRTESRASDIAWFTLRDGNCGAARIAKERCRQLEPREYGGEGWTEGHDDGHIYGEMLIAAQFYCFAAYRQINAAARNFVDVDLSIETMNRSTSFMQKWPWSDTWWKPSRDPIRNLEKAGALIAAQIDMKLQCAAAMAKEKEGHR